VGGSARRDGGRLVVVERAGDFERARGLPKASEGGEREAEIEVSAPRVAVPADHGLGLVGCLFESTREVEHPRKMNREV
jgi:hypothetical protein